MKDDTRELSEHEKYAAGLRQYAAWIEAHPEVALPSSYMENYAVDSKEDARVVARALGSFEKEANDWHFTLSKSFGPIKARFVFTRSRVCTRKVVGVETIPARFVEAHTEPATTKEVVEWECEPLLEKGIEA